MVKKERLLATFTDLLGIDAPSRQEAPVARYVLDYLARVGAEAREDDAAHAVEGDCGNVVGLMRGPLPNVPPLLFNAHLDTITSTAGLKIMPDGPLIRSDGTTILGADDRAGVAILLEVLTSLKEDNAQVGDLELAFTVCEEIGLLGTRHLDFSRLKAKVAAVLDGGDDLAKVTHAAPTHKRLFVTVRGKEAHAAVHPESGVNAIVLASRAMAKMLLGRVDTETTANVGVIHGGEATNIIPGEVRVECEARSRDEEKLDRQLEHMRSLFVEEATLVGGQAEVEEVLLYRGYRLAEDDPAIRLARAALQRMGNTLVMEPGFGGTDANRFYAAGISAVVLGTGAENPHSKEEYVNTDVMVDAARLLCEMAIVQAEGLQGIIE